MLFDIKLESPAIVCAPCKYWPAEIVYAVVVGVYVAAAFLVTPEPTYVEEIAFTVTLLKPS